MRESLGVSVPTLAVAGLLLVAVSMDGCASERIGEGAEVAETDQGRLPFPGTITGREEATMALVPGGPFEMGSPGARRTVDLPSFYMDIHEVTNARYHRFVEETDQSQPHAWKDLDGRASDQPVITLAWADAEAYCRWAGKRLPTEAEWEKAARGGHAAKSYPWGDDPPDPNGPWRANFDAGPTGDADGYAKTAPMGSFPANGYGLYDMAGNVWEWCSDPYLPEQQESTPLLGWVGDTEHHILRGGGWLIADYMSDERYILDLRVDFRMTYNAEAQDQNIGCRCVADASTSRPVRMP